MNKMYEKVMCAVVAVVVCLVSIGLVGEFVGECLDTYSTGLVQHSENEGVQ